jgi:flagellar basal body-associated protein FliL
MTMKLGGKTILIAAMIPVAMLLSAGLTYVLIAPAAGAAVKTEGGEESGVEAEVDDVPADATVEVLIDNFNCTNNRAAAGSTIHVSFKVVCIVKDGQNLAFEELANKTHKTRTRQSIERIIRSAALEDLHDPNLSTIRRQIREEVNKVVGKNFVLDVAVSDIRLIEQ